MLFMALTVVFAAAVMMTYMVVTSFAGGGREYEDRYLNRTAALLSETYLFIPVERIMTLKVISGFSLGAVTLLLTLQLMRPVPIVLACLAAAFGAFLPDIILRLKVSQRRKKFNNQLIDAMNTISNGLRSGFSLQQAIQLAARQMPDPVGQEFRIAAREIALGTRTEDSLENMNKRLNDKDLQLVVAAVRLTMQTGGNLPEIFKQLSETIRERNRMDRKIRALTSQGKLQAVIVVLIPLGMGIVVNFLNPDVMRLMYTTLMGWAMIAAIAVLDLVGFFLIRRIVTIRL